MPIRILTVDDTLEYRRLRLESFRADPFAFSESHTDEAIRSIQAISRDIEPEGNPARTFTLGYFESGSPRGRLVGIVSFRGDPRSKAHHKGRVTAMFVDPRVRGAGVGRQLMDELIRRTRALHGLEQIHLWVLVRSGSRSAVDFYAKSGFETCGPFVHKDIKVGNEYADAQYMTLML